MDELERSLRELEQALAEVRAGAARLPAVEPTGPPSADRVSDAERRLTALSAALAATREAASRLDDVANVALGQEGRRVVRLQRALAHAELERPAAVAAERSPAPAGRPRRRRRALALAPGVVVAGAAATVLASVAVDNTVNPFGTRQSPTLPAERPAPRPLTIAPGGSVVAQPSYRADAGRSGTRHHPTPASSTAADSAARAAAAPAGSGVRRFAGLPSLRRPAATPSQPDRPARTPQGGGGGHAPAATPAPTPAVVTVPPAAATPAPAPAASATVTAAVSTPAVPPAATPQAPVAVTASVTVGSLTVAALSVGGRIGVVTLPAVTRPSYPVETHDADDGAWATPVLTSPATLGKRGRGHDADD
jgi:hypothetical protein